MSNLPSTSYVVIPARLASTRLPRKLLLRDTGQTVVQHTYEAARRATRPAGVCVATDHEEIAAEVRHFGGHVEMTDPRAASGTDRVVELAARFDDVDIFVNVQGDEPEIPSTSIDAAIALLEANPTAAMSTLAAPIRTWEQVASPHCVKVLFDDTGRALYFSRSPIPYVKARDDSLLKLDPPVFWQHVGLYAYRREFLLHLAGLRPGRLELIESLEQLRVLAAGYTIVVGRVDEPPIEIDTWEDYRVFVNRYLSRRRMDEESDRHANSVAAR